MKLLAVDGNSILNRAFYGVRLLSNQKGMYTNAIFGFFQILLRLEKEFAPDRFAITFDLKTPTFRHKQYTEYKANRKGMPDELAMQLAPLKQLLTALGYPLLSKEGYEADDCLGTLAKICAEEQVECIIATGDRDALQLVDEKVKVCLIKTKGDVVYTPALFEQEYGCPPCGLVEVKALMGDSSDNIPGVKGIGEKTACKLISEHHTLEQLYEGLEQAALTPRVKGLLREGKDMAFLSRELATICREVPLETTLSDLQKGEGDPQEAVALLTELEMFRLIDRLGLPQLRETEAVKENIHTKTLLLDPTIEQVRSALEKVSTVDYIWEEPTLTVCLPEAVAVFAGEGEAALEALVLNASKPTRTLQAKPVFAWALPKGKRVPLPQFDVTLAAYLLQVSAKQYPLEALVQKYLPYEQYAIEEGYRGAAALSDLCDVLTAQLQEQSMWALLQDIEIPLCEVLVLMELRGIKVDVEGLTRYGEVLAEEIAGLKQMLFLQAGQQFNPNSPKELGVLLFEKLGLPVRKKTKTGYSTNAEVLESLVDAHPIIENLLTYRKLTKLYSTYVVGLLAAVDEEQRVHSTFQQTETRTGRISSTDPNLQNIPVRTEEGSRIREFFVARSGYVLVDADYSQIELRILAHIANDKAMQEAFVRGMDIHRMTAAEVFGVLPEAVSPAQRSHAKAINFGIVYGIGAFSLAKDLQISVAKAKQYMDAYFRTYHGVKQYMEQVVDKAIEQGFVTTLYHRRRELEEIRSTNKTVQANAKRIAFNTPIQGTAADIIKIAMIRVERRLQKELPDAHLLLQVHDELIVEAKESEVEAVKGLLQEEMEQAAALSVALTVDTGAGENWLAAK